MHLYQSLSPTRDIQLSASAESHAVEIMKEIGSGFIDFQMPDKGWQVTDFGYVSFPSKINCKPDKRASSIYLSTMLAAIGFRPKLIEYFVEHYSELGIANTNMLFTIQIDEDVSYDVLFRIVSILKAKGVYFDVYI